LRYVQGSHILTKCLFSCSCDCCTTRITSDLKFISDSFYPLLQDRIHPKDIIQCCSFKQSSFNKLYPVCNRLIISEGTKDNKKVLRRRKKRGPFETSPVYRVVKGAQKIGDLFLRHSISEENSDDANERESYITKKARRDKAKALLSQEDWHKKRELALSKGSQDWIAEVVVLVEENEKTYDGVQSMKLIHLLKCHGVEFFEIIGNAHLASPKGPESKLVVGMYHLGRLVKDQGKLEKRTHVPIALPQVLIDGIVVGDGVDIEDLIEDNDLDYILAREMCSRCLAPRSGSDCPFCGAVYRYMVDRELLGDDYFKLTQRCAFASGSDSVQSAADVKRKFSIRTGLEQIATNEPSTAEDFKLRQKAIVSANKKKFGKK